MARPFFAYGDTGKIYEFLSLPLWVTLPLSGIALFALIYFFRRITPWIGRNLSRLTEDYSFERRKTVHLFFTVPVLIGTVSNLLISLPAPTFMSILLPVITTTTLIPSAIRLYASEVYITPADPAANTQKPRKDIYWPLISMVLLLILSRILAGGIQF
jgi:hypothetical protein